MKQYKVFQELTKDSKMIFKLIQKNKAITKKDLCILTNNNITTLNRFFQPLEKHGLVIEAGAADSRGGRKPVLYSVNPKQHYIGAINISSTYYDVAIINLELEIISINHFLISNKDLPDIVIQNIVTDFNKQCSILGISKEQILGVGLTVFSSFDHKIGKIEKPINLYLHEEWIGYDLEENLKIQLKLPIVVENSTAAVAMLEYFYGAGKESSKLMYILCAMNIRSMTINQGELLSDAMYYEDAFGHSTVDFDGIKCTCGNYGCVNCYATIPAILNNFNKNKKAGMDTILKDKQDASIEDICQAAAEGDSLSVQTITYAATMLGIGISNYINMVRPNVVIMSGILVDLSKLYYETCVRVAEERLKYFIKPDQILFKKSGYYSKPLVVSAGAILLEELLKDEI